MNMVFLNFVGPGHVPSPSTRRWSWRTATRGCCSRTATCAAGTSCSSGPGELHYEYNHQGTRYHVEEAIPDGNAPSSLSVHFTKTGELHGLATLLCDGVEIGAGEIASTARYMIGWQGLTVGCDSLSPVSWDYAGGFPFTGMLEHVDLALADDGPHDVHEVID
jgi:hypothetical protein